MGQESQRRMLAMLMGSQESLLTKSSFSAWSECVYQSRQLREVEQMKRDMRSKGDESTKRMLGMLMGAQAEVLTKAAFAGWHELAVQETIARMRGNMAHMKAKGEEGTKRMLGMLLGSQGELMQKAMFTAWHELIALAKQEREVDRMKAGMKAKGEESTKRMLAMLMGSQEEVLKKATFAGWHDYVFEVKQHNEMRKLQHSMRAKGAESNKRMLGMLVGSQSNLVMKIAFTGWSDSHYEAKKLREVEKMRRQMKSKGDESTKRMLGMLMSSQGEALLKAVLSGWHETAVASHIARMRDDLSHLKSKKEEGTKRML